MSTFAILPVKRFDSAKQRLAEGVAPGVRRALAQAMCADVLLALRRARNVDDVLVVTDENDAIALASGHGIDVVRDPAEAGQSAAAALGIERAAARGCERALLVPGDCPALDPAEIDALLEGAPAGAKSVVIVPDRHGTGTNALVLSPPTVIEPAFGDDSMQRHRWLARTAGVEPAIEKVPSLLLDVDTPDDLAALREALEGARGRAPNTRGMLRQLDRSEMPAAG